MPATFYPRIARKRVVEVELIDLPTITWGGPNHELWISAKRRVQVENRVREMVQDELRSLRAVADSTEQALLARGYLADIEGALHSSLDSGAEADLYSAIEMLEQMSEASTEAWEAAGRTGDRLGVQIACRVFFMLVHRFTI